MFTIFNDQLGYGRQACSETCMARKLIVQCGCYDMLDILSKSNAFKEIPGIKLVRDCYGNENETDYPVFVNVSTGTDQWKECESLTDDTQRQLSTMEKDCYSKCPMRCLETVYQAFSHVYHVELPMDGIFSKSRLVSMQTGDRIARLNILHDAMQYTKITGQSVLVI